MPDPAWKIRQTKAGTITEIDKLLDHRTCTEIAGILRSRGLPNGEGRQFTPTMVQRVIRTYQPRSHRQRLLDAGLIPLAQMADALGVSTGTVKMPMRSACPPAPSRSGTTPELSAGNGITTKRKSSTTRPGPTRRPPTKDAGTTPFDLHERHLAVNRSEEVQYAQHRIQRGLLHNYLAFRARGALKRQA